ncbi:Archaeosine synthase [Candidatus Methanobinarius endosymbioticus]|uniref:Archaeosine synthase n=1 Tax=Candidatus Methanobinarius endosymbioticus TaxID=2006182 RepID=A0A366MD76_9EURY|nr:Archaeosine synthase [Candidatus Methanobinarius endosymbioticus]
MKVICSNEESLYRPEAHRWRERMQLMNPIGDVVVVLPCSMKKPYSNSKSHQKFRRVTKGYQELILTSPFGICPREMENTFPIQSYDVGVSGDWSFEEKKLAGELLKNYVKDKDVIANVSGGYEEVCREYLDDVSYTAIESRPTSNDSLYNLRMELKKYKKVKGKERHLNELRSIAIYQFGHNGDKFISDDTIAKGMYYRRIFTKSKQIALLNRGAGFFSIRLAGGDILNDLGIHIVEIDFELKTNTLFAPGVEKADKNIIPNDEVVVVKNGEVVGVGKAVLNGEEMETLSNGVAVRINDRKK